MSHCNCKECIADGGDFCKGGKITKYLEFKLSEIKPKTLVYKVLSKSSDFLLGIIKWYSRWRQYCFFPTEETIFNTGCLLDISTFIEELNRRHKKRRVGKNDK